MDHQNKLALREAEEAMEESRRMRLQSEEEHRQAQAKMDHVIKVKALEQGQSPESAKALAAEQANVQLRREFAALQTAVRELTRSDRVRSSIETGLLVSELQHLELVEVSARTTSALRRDALNPDVERLLKERADVAVAAARSAAAKEWRASCPGRSDDATGGAGRV